MTDHIQICPRSHELGCMPNDGSEWRKDNTCSYCGSLNPEEFIQLCIDGKITLEPTDKNYKVYYKTDEKQGKFYFQHLSVEARHLFSDLCNDEKLNVDYPGYFYVWPFFMRKV